MEEENASERLQSILSELSRRNERLAALQMEKYELEEDLKRLSSRAAVMGGDIGKMQVQERYKMRLKGKLRRLSSLMIEAEADFMRAQEHLKYLEAEEGLENSANQAKKGLKQ